MDVIVPQFVISDDHTDDTKATLLSSSITASAVTLWDVGTTYALDDVRLYMDTTGSEAGVYKTYKSLQAANTGNNPQTANAWWVSQGATERYKMFDLYRNTVTTDAASDIVVNLHCRGITSVGFLNVLASGITVEAWAGSELGDKIEANYIGSYTVNLDQPIADWHEWWFADFEYTRDITITGDISDYYNIVLEITFSKITGLDCYVGHCIPGRKYTIGSSQWGVETGIDDYSRIVEDDIFGETYLSQGNYRKLIDINLKVLNIDLNKTNTILTELRAIPTIWEGNQKNTSYNNLITYGFCKKFRIIMPGSVYSECRLQIRGMI